MYRSVFWQILYFFLFYQLHTALTLTSSFSGTNFTHWSEDDWLETRFLINTKFIFNRQPYDHIHLRTRMNEWSLEFSYGNRTHLNKLWTELHIFLDRHLSLTNSIHGHVRSVCHPPIFSPLTNDSNTRIPELADMDERIARYFTTDGFFRTINYIHCSFDERRQNPSFHIQMHIYFVTNREFQSLIYVEMSNTTRNELFHRQARFYLHNYERKVKMNFNVSDIIYPLNSNTSLVHMIKLYNQTGHARSSSLTLMMTMKINLLYSLLTLYLLCY